MRALNSLFNSFEVYKGAKMSVLEVEICNLKTELSDEKFNSLYSAFEKYRDYIFETLARTPRVVIKFHESDSFVAPFDCLDLFQDFDKMENKKISQN